MSDQNTPDVTELFRDAKAAGEISPHTANILNGLSARINKTMVLPAAKPSVTEMTLLCMLIDNTPSMEHKNNHAAAIEGHNLVVSALLGAKAANSIEELTMLINHHDGYARKITGDSDEFQWRSLRAAPRLEKRNFIQGCSTPLYDRCLEALGSVLARTKWWEDQFGVQTRSVTLLMTDGGNNDGKAEISHVAKVVADMLAMEKHRIFFMGVDAGGVDFRKIGADMGLPAECVDVVERDPRAIRNRFQLFSQSAAAIVGGAPSPVSLF